MSAPHPRSFRLWQALLLLSVGVAIGGAAIIARLLHTWMAWPASGFTATAAFVVLHEDVRPYAG